MGAIRLGVLQLGSQYPLVKERGWKGGNLVPSNYKRLHALNCLQSYSSPSKPSIQEHMVHLETELCTNRIEELKQEVKKELCNGQDLKGTMALIDTIQHLGLGYHFQEDITMLLDRSYVTKCEDYDLFSTSLCFRLLRQGGYNVTQDVFHRFMAKDGQLKEDLREDLFGLLSLHEASYLGARGEEVLSQAMLFSKHHLNRSMPGLEPSVARDIGIALAFPRQRRMEKSEAKRYIKKFATESGRSSKLLELANLDFNMVQRLHEQEIGELVSWWNELGLAKKLSFARDRPLECFLWAVGMFPEPCFSRCRIEVAKTVAILLVIDDIYDIYGSLDELILFSDAIQRWGTDAMENLPEYMKIAYMALYNTTNEIAYRILREHGLSVVPHLRKTWVDLCEAFLLEARLFRGGTVPPLEDYLHNGITTAGTYMAFVHAFFLMGKQVNKESIDFVNSCPDIFTNSGRILRLWDDLGTTKEEQLRGDDASSLNCYMKHKQNSTEDDARDHIRLLIDSSWQDLNQEALSTSELPRSIIKASLNLARTAQSVYQHGDDERVPSIDENIQDLLIKPIYHEYL